MLILHIAYAFIPPGFILTALSAFELVAPGAGIHAWTGGAIGTMTLAVMSRETLGHTGQRLEASPATHLIYAAVIIAAVARVCAALEVGPHRRVCWRLPVLPGPWLSRFAAAYSVAFWSPRRF